MAQGPRRGSSGDKSKRPQSGRPSSGRPSSGKPAGPRTPGSYSGRSGPGSDRRPTGGGYRDDRGDRPGGSGNDRAQRSYGDRPDRGDRPYGDRPQRSYGDRPQGDRPQRSYGDRPDRGDRPYGDRPQGDRPQRSYGDRPSGDRSYGDRPQRSYGDRPQGDRPQRSYGDRPQGDRPQRSYVDRPSGDRSYGDRPQRSYGDRPSGDRPQRSYGDRPDRGGDRGRYNAGRSDRGGYRDDRRGMDRPNRPTGPALPDDVTGQELDQSIRGDLRTLALEAATLVSRHLVMAERVLEDNPELAWEHAKAAVSRGGRLAVVREAAGVSAYAAGHYADALAQFRAARRISGSDAYWPVMADCERGLGRPERAITMAGAPEADRLDREGRVELRIVAAGARRDLGQVDAALVTLQCPELSTDEVASWSARIKFAYADTLVELGRADEAREWFVRASEVDVNDETEAAERLAEMDGLVWVDLQDEDDEVTAEAIVEIAEGEQTDLDDEELDDEELDDEELDDEELDDDEGDEFEDDEFESDLDDDEEEMDDAQTVRPLLVEVAEADDLLEKLEAEALALERAAAEAIAAVAAARAALDSRIHQDSEDSSSD